jgi:hypothetical protein
MRLFETMFLYNIKGLLRVSYETFKRLLRVHYESCATLKGFAKMGNPDCCRRESGSTDVSEPAGSGGLGTVVEVVASDRADFQGIAVFCLAQLH